MKQKISGPVGAAIVVIALIIIVVAFYRLYLYKPTMTPQEAFAKLAEGQKKMQQGMQQRANTGAQGNGAPAPSGP